MKNLFPFLFLIALVGCAKTIPPSYYILTAQEPLQTEQREQNNNTPRIGILPIVMPNYLLRPEIVLKNSGQTQVNIEEFHQWAEELPTAFQRVLSISLSNAMPKASIMPVRMGFIVDYKLNLDVRSFEGNLNADSLLDVLWTLQKDSKVLLEGHFIQTLPSGPSFNSLVEAQSNLINMLGNEIGQQVLQLL